MIFYCSVFIATYTFSVLYFADEEYSHPKYQDGLDGSYHNLLTTLLVSILVPNPAKYDISFLSVQNFTSICLYWIISHILFYVTHRILHEKPFYKAFHKQHHKWNENVISPSTFDCHPFEFWFCNMLSFVPALNLPLTTFTRYVLIIIGTISGVSSHAGSYEQAHIKHHKLVRCNYSMGPFYFMDKLCGTYR